MDFSAVFTILDDVRTKLKELEKAAPGAAASAPTAERAEIARSVNWAADSLRLGSELVRADFWIDRGSPDPWREEN